ncbi:hypochlorite stress DNA-binding transcriptional regulator HypT [Actinobacillus genomosp. 2]|uniref:hypochlorite stress DNA-binding transcriptional regulator HypT n=1 Tax=Actinobacillus genomosp. 2 TaxID=230709 RepID=UPI002442768F|nr:hypochlorite stress DNA-binding transcriptional regulator HypT [Actinobacillus genomosp. 2]WGE31823.1 hypochlorite stress DNA-binding transcriptional regulator HypT [Actinobacillus genomosp. 2]
MKNIETKWLEDFLTLEEYRNFSLAAEKRNLSQSAFSRRISSLEDVLGVKLFDRTAIPLQLTNEGKLFHSQTRNLLQQLRDNLDELLGNNNHLPNIKIAAAHSLSLSIMPNLIRELSQKGENFIYSVEAIDVEETVHTLIEGKSDFIFSFYDEKLMQEPFLSVEILQSKLYPISPTNLRGEVLFHLDDPNIPLLNYTPNSYMGRLVNRKLAQTELIHTQTKFISSMSELLKNMVLNKQGIAWLPEYTIKEELALKKVKILEHEELVIPIKGYIYRMNTRLNNVAEKFWDYLKHK